MKFYLFKQNNSGGEWIVNNNLSVFVAIESLTARNANRMAEKIGIYFDGVAKGEDCECCGNRWEPVDEFFTYNICQNLGDLKKRLNEYCHEYRRLYTDLKNRPVAVIYYSDGTKEVL